MSSDRPPPEFFFDRSLGKAAARRLRDRGWIIHLIADFYEGDAAETTDATWIAEGCSLGWILLTKDKKIRYRTEELAALARGHLFCLVSGNLGLDDMAQRFVDAQPAMLRAADTHTVGFWHVHAGGRISRMWPT